MYLGLDLGTSELKALLLADDHRIVGVARAPLTVSRPRPLWSEQSPSQWWDALEAVMQTLRAAHGDALVSVRAIGLSGQMHGAVLLDEAGEVLRPAILGTTAAARHSASSSRGRCRVSASWPATWRCPASRRPS